MRSPRLSFWSGRWRKTPLPLSGELQSLRGVIRRFKASLRGPEYYRAQSRESALRAYYAKRDRVLAQKSDRFRFSGAIHHLATLPEQGRNSDRRVFFAACRQYKKEERAKYGKLVDRVRKRFEKATRKRGGISGRVVREMSGCSLPDLREHVERLFLPGMSWDNWAFDGWHLDHVRPLASFDLRDPAQVRAAFHFTNLQPLWAKDNLTKRDVYTV